MGMHEHKGDSAWQTESLLISYEETLQSFNATLAGNCIRTWFFVRDVDTQYAGMVKARKENFAEQGLTERTTTSAARASADCLRIHGLWYRWERMPYGV